MIRFGEYFNSWLHKEYYATGVQIGKGGDFYTSVSVGWLFGVCLSNYFLNLLQNNIFSKNTSIVEIGANDGSMMADFIQGIYTLRPDLLSSLKFVILEPHKKLIHMQRQKLKDFLDSGVNINWISNLDNVYIDEAFIMSNEIFDSFECELYNKGNIAYVQRDKRLRLVWKEASDEINKIAKNANITCGEVCVSYFEFAKKLVNTIGKGRFISFDYGDLFSRGDFSLRIYQKHQVFNIFEIENLDDFYGKSDITYDVCFLLLRQAFEKYGWFFSSFKTQSRAIIDDCMVGDLITLIERKADKTILQNALKQLKYLTSPFFLGERFKFIEFIKSK